MGEMGPELGEGLEQQRCSCRGGSSGDPAAGVGAAKVQLQVWEQQRSSCRCGSSGNPAAGVGAGMQSRTTQSLFVSLSSDSVGSD